MPIGGGLNKLTPRERELAAIRHEIPDRIPVDALAIENAEDVGRVLGVPKDGVPERLGLDGRVVSVAYEGDKPAPPVGEDAATEWGSHAQGDYGSGHAYPLAAAATREEIDRHPWPDPARYSYSLAAQAARAWHAEYAVRGPYWFPLFCRTCSLMGMEEAMVKMHAEPRLFEAVLDHVFERVLELSRRFVAACGDSLDIFQIGDDFATQRGMLIDPRLWRRFLKPRLARLFEVGKRAGRFVWFHSCGDITAVLPDLIDIGMDVWETVQLHTLPIPARELKRQYGRHIAFFGAINTQALPFRRREELVREVTECCRVLGEGGGYICGPDHHVKPDVPAATTVALFETARSFRHPGCTAERGASAAHL